MPAAHRFRQTLPGLAALLLISSCAADAGSGATAPSAPPVPSSAVATADADATANPYGEPPARSSPVLPDSEVLSVVPLGASPLTFTGESLAALGSTDLEVDEPFVGRRQTFTGVPMATVLAAASIPATGTLDTVGVDDYTFSAPASEFLAANALVAYAVDGAPIDPADGGPIRLVYPDGTTLAADRDAWTWRLVSIQQVA